MRASRKPDLLLSRPNPDNINADNVSGHAVATGKVLWEHDWHGKSSLDANVAWAVQLPPDRILVSKGYGR